MNDNDVADQLCLVYRIMRFQRNIKWWWALFLWGYEVPRGTAGWLDRFTTVAMDWSTVVRAIPVALADFHGDATLA